VVSDEAMAGGLARLVEDLGSNSLCEVYIVLPKRIPEREKPCFRAHFP
jgi:hypothetical protein